MKKIRAIGLLSGGLDSSLAVKLVRDHDIEVIALKFTSPFCQCDSGGRCHAANVSKQLGIELRILQKGDEYLEIVRNPKFRRGSGMNPCIDCRIFMLKKADKIAQELGADFIFTGEVIGQRPMSQHRKTIELIEREAGLEGKIVRPLSGKLFPPTHAEKMGWVSRDWMFSISGRGRKSQISLAAENGLFDYPCPAGGCLLTSKEFSARLRDFFDFNQGKKLTFNDVALLKIGRHFRIGQCKLVVGRDEAENNALTMLALEGFSALSPTSIPGPTGLIENGYPEVLPLATSIIARYSDNLGSEVEVQISGELESSIKAVPADPEAFDRYMIRPRARTEARPNEGSVV